MHYSALLYRILWWVCFIPQSTQSYAKRETLLWVYKRHCNRRVHYVIFINIFTSYDNHFVCVSRCTNIFIKLFCGNISRTGEWRNNLFELVTKNLEGRIERYTTRTISSEHPTTFTPAGKCRTGSWARKKPTQTNSDDRRRGGHSGR